MHRSMSILLPINCINPFHKRGIYVILGFASCFIRQYFDEVERFAFFYEFDQINFQLSFVNLSFCQPLESFPVVWLADYFLITQSILLFILKAKLLINKNPPRKLVVPTDWPLFFL